MFVWGVTNEDLVALVQEAEKRANYKIGQYFKDEGPHRRELYQKHLLFFAAGALYKERLFMAANRVGKSESGAFETTCHLTGDYPHWWEGRRFTKPVQWWACGTTSETTRDIVQEKLCGGINQLGLGMIPAHRIIHHTKRPHGLPGSLEQVWVRHASGGLSTIGFKAYEQGRQSFEGTARDGVWCDEEPPQDCYTEMLYRTMTTEGIIYTTFTPLQGMSDVVRGFLEPEKSEAKNYKVMIQAGWDDVPHLAEDEKKMLLATTPPFQRDARSKGLPQLGAGAIYQMPESELQCAPFNIPAHWPRCYGMDTGGTTAVVWGAIDRESDTLYIYDVYKREHPEPAIHFEAIKARGLWIPGVADAAALLMTAHDREQTIRLYKKMGLDIQLPDKAVETGIQEVWELMSGGRFKVFVNCTQWWQEYRLYHRDERGKIVKMNDHAMDATRYMVRSGRNRAKTKPGQRKQAMRIAEPTQPGLGWLA